MEQEQEQLTSTSSSVGRKVYITRIPLHFTEDIVKRIVIDKLCEQEEKIGGGDDGTVVESIELVYPRDEGADDGNKKKDKRENESSDQPKKEHRGFGFMTFTSATYCEKALGLKTIKGGKKPTSKRLHTMHIRPYIQTTDKDDDNTKATTGGTDHNICYLWSLHRCPYGEKCKFEHVGDGGCIPEKDDGPDLLGKKKKGKCFAYKKNGKCPKGDDCPFSHDFAPKSNAIKQQERLNETSSSKNGIIDDKSQKDCINWKTKGKCRKGEKCPFRHDPELQSSALEKLENKKKRKKNGVSEGIDDGTAPKKQKQPLAIRVFGLNYDTTEEDVREFFKDCGIVNKIEFPTFEDSLRSKGYCGVWFASPKAVTKALQLDGQELHGRWLRIQSGKMLLREWEGGGGHHEANQSNKRSKVGTEYRNLM
jgi:RNA recognition motif-containing protein